MKQGFRQFAAALVLPFLLVNTNLLCQVAEPSAEIKEVKDELSKLRGEFDELIKVLKARRVLPTPPFNPVDAVIDLSTANVKGNSDSKYVVVEMSDFQCPFCARYSTQTYPNIIKNYVDTGKIQYAFMDFPLVSLHKEARKAGEVARCAGDQGKFWEMHDYMFANFQEIAKQDWASFGAAVGVEPGEFSSCIDSSKYAETVTADMKTGAQLGVSGTPTFFLGEIGADGKVNVWKKGSGAQPYQTFEVELNKMLAGEAAGE